MTTLTNVATTPSFANADVDTSFANANVDTSFANADVDTSFANANADRVHIVTVEGNIGAGKSTLVEKMKRHYQDRTDIMFLQEPVDLWSRFTQDGKNILECFYENQEKYSFPFQVLAYSTRLQLIEQAVAEATKNNIRTIVMERSLEADRYVFAKLLYGDKKIEDCMYQIYLNMSDYGMQKHSADSVLWLHAGPQVCLERIQKRGREGEDKISMEYLAKCDACHQEWLGKEVEGGKTKVYRIGEDSDVDWNQMDKVLG
jgi:deoxycitidine kinase/deoxyguanosine kinase